MYARVSGGIWHGAFGSEYGHASASFAHRIVSGEA